MRLPPEAVALQHFLNRFAAQLVLPAGTPLYRSSWRRDLSSLAGECWYWAERDAALQYIGFGTNTRPLPADGRLEDGRVSSLLEVAARQDLVLIDLGAASVHSVISSAKLHSVFAEHGQAILAGHPLAAAEVASLTRCVAGSVREYDIASPGSSLDVYQTLDPPAVIALFKQRFPRRC